MKNAQHVLVTLAKRPTYKDDSAYGAFVREIIMAVNDEAQLNELQENFLSGLISTYLSVNRGGIIEAMSVATWINSCR